MTALIITGAVVLLITVFLSLPIVFVIDYEKEAEIKMRLLFFNLFKEKEPKKLKKRKIKHRKPKKSTAPPQAARQTNLAPKKEKSVVKNIPDLDISMLKMLVGSMAHPIKRLIKKIKVTELNIDSVVGGSDAAKAAINYGLQNAAVYSGVVWLDSITNVKVERINIQADFCREESEFALHCKVKIKSGTVLVCLLAFMLKMASLNSGGKHRPKRQTAYKSGGIGKTIRIVID
ncbi:MAG: hypothetical protein FWE74_00495 [Oscillospiraceae bacterium]|nr:hypothetical protein [Oscillospiraceae bacterium]